MSAAEHKDSKITAQYEEGRGTRRCGICKYYRIGRCTTVGGNIDPYMVCKHFKIREDI